MRRQEAWSPEAECRTRLLGKHRKLAESKSRTRQDQFKDGSSVGLMGSTGCGKSTIIQMLGRFYDPVAGSVEINGRDLRSFDVKTWRHSISAVLQEPSLFSGSVYDNICYGVPNGPLAAPSRVSRTNWLNLLSPTSR